MCSRVSSCDDDEMFVSIPSSETLVAWYISTVDLRKIVTFMENFIPYKSEIDDNLDYLISTNSITVKSFSSHDPIDVIINQTTTSQHSMRNRSRKTHGTRWVEVTSEECR